MAESVPVRCPACRREHTFTPPTFPCACGAPVTPPLLHGGVPVQIRHRSWDNSWIHLRCPRCARVDQWPQAEFGCPCGAVIRMPVDTRAVARPGSPPGPVRPVAGPVPGPAPSFPPSVRRPPFRPVTIRTARDALSAAAQYVTWLGFTDIRISDDRPATGVDLWGRGIVAQVDPTTAPATLRDIETLWLNCLNENAACAFFSLAGYAHDARQRAESLRVPLFVMDLTGTPQPVNDAAEALVRNGPRHR